MLISLCCLVILGPPPRPLDLTLAGFLSIWYFLLCPWQQPLSRLLAVLWLLLT